MTNALLLILVIPFLFSAVLAALKWFGREGLYAWIALASVLANIIVAKNIVILGLDATLGNVLFSSVFLATDILTEYDGAKAARRGVFIGLFSVFIYLAVIQISLLFLPSRIDTVHDSMKALFALAPRICLASVLMFFLANIMDVVLYQALRERFGGKKMWLRNNLCTIVCNCLENFGFVTLAFAGVYPVRELMMIAVSTSILETFIAVCDTPFLYLAGRINRKPVQEND